MNRVPKRWAEKDIYCQLIANEDDNNPYYDVVPRPYAFEVSTVTNDSEDILFYSKLMSRAWPHTKALAQRIKAFVDDVNAKTKGLKEKYFTSGRVTVDPNTMRRTMGASTNSAMGRTSPRAAAAATA